MIPTFQNGQQGSATTLMSAFNALRLQGQSVLQFLSTAETDTLGQLQRRLSALNGRRQQANRCSTRRVLGHLSLYDLLDVDQSNTTSTLRIDAGVTTLRERSTPLLAQVLNLNFSTDTGTVDAQGDLYQVTVSDSNAPTGTFDIELASPLALSMVMLDIVALASNPDVQVQVSSTGSSYTPATIVRVNGYRISAWFAAQTARYIRLIITPSHPDNLGGSIYTFGVTQVDALAADFQLLSQLVGRPLSINPVGTSFYFVADADPGVIFFLSVAGQPFAQVASGTYVQIPGAQSITTPGVTLDSTGNLTSALPASLYLPSLEVIDASTGNTMPLAPGMPVNPPGVSSLLTQYVAINGTTMSLAPFNSATDAGRTFNLSYAQGPSSVTVQLRVQLSTEDRTTTPCFRSASFQEA